MANKKTHDQFVKEVYDLVKDEYTVIGDYINTKTKIKMLHNSCNNEYEVEPASLLSGTRCPHCFGKHKKTQEQFEQEIYDLVGDEYVVLGSYISGAKPVKMRHVECDHEWETIPRNFLFCGNRCPKCNGGLKYTHEEFIDRVYELVGDEYEVLGEYINNKTKIKMLHKTCGNEYDVTPSKFTNVGRRCPKCKGGVRKTHEEFMRDFNEIFGDDYTVLGEYKSAFTFIKMRHNVCGLEYEARPSNITNEGNGCPVCKSSRGEREISAWLIENSVEFIPQYKFADCMRKRRLPFDFAIMNGDQVSLLIEFHGEQHYDPVEHFGGEEKFKEQQKNDKIKLDYCKANDIPLLIIPHWESENIHNILSKELLNA